MIIGRQIEKKTLEKLYTSKESEFLVVYGRRRVGKTYLIREFFKNKKGVLFHATGLEKGSMHTQISKFIETISAQFFEGVPLQIPSGWGDAFRLLHQQVLKLGRKKVVIFFDELPWMATRKSGLLEEIDYYWNQYWSNQGNIILIVCGSSASWLINKIIYNKGGLHNRVTAEIKLSPFNLAETYEYLKYRKIKLNKRQIMTLYMALGGIPYYLKYVEPGLSADENIQRIFFSQNAPLKDEFIKLFNSLFENADAYIEIVSLLAKRKEGFSRAEIKTITKLSTGGGRLTERLNDLCNTGFIQEHIPWDKSRGEYYKLIDEFCLFYFNWLYKKSKNISHDFWLSLIRSSSYYVWAGYAFEALCHKHVANIVEKLNIKAGYNVSAWAYRPRKRVEHGAQIDLILDRSDNSLTICEIKYTDNPFVIDKRYADILQKKLEIFKSITNTSKQIFFVIISASGLKNNNHSKELVDNIIVADDLFEPA